MSDSKLYGIPENDRYLLLDAVKHKLNSNEFKKCWNNFVEAKVIDTSYSFEEICCFFFTFGEINALKHLNEEAGKDDRP